MAQRYIDREGLMEEETVEIVKMDELSILKKEISSLKEYNEIRGESDKIMSILMEDKEIQELLIKKLKDDDLIKKVRLLV